MRSIIRIARLCLVVCLCFAVRVAVVNAQCTPHPSHETTVSVINVSNWPITFSVDGVTRTTVPPAEVSIDFNVGPGQHLLLAETSVDGETFSVSRRMVVPAGSMCVWTVTTPSKDSRRPQSPFIDPLTRIAVISLAIPVGI
jgi:hypothetical protein